MSEITRENLQKAGYIRQIYNNNKLDFWKKWLDSAHTNDERSTYIRICFEAHSDSFFEQNICAPFGLLRIHLDSIEELEQLFKLLAK